MVLTDGQALEIVIRSGWKQLSAQQKGMMLIHMTKAASSLETPKFKRDVLRQMLPDLNAELHGNYPPPITDREWRS